MHWIWNITGTDILIFLLFANIVMLSRRISVAHKRIDILRQKLNLD